MKCLLPIIEYMRVLPTHHAQNEWHHCLLNDSNYYIIFTTRRDSKKNAEFTVQQAAIDFSIPEATVTSLLAMARSPTIKRDIESAELAIAE